MKDIPPDDNHVFDLVKVISSSYLKIRLHHLAREKTFSITENFVRSKLTKAVLFQHQ